MAIRLYLGSDPVAVHVARRNASESFCGTEVEAFRPVGTIDDPSSFTPQFGAVHDECLAVFAQRHDRDVPRGEDADLSWSDEQTGWEDLGDTSN